MFPIGELVREERGLETVEYAIISGLVVAGVIAAVTALGIWLSNQFIHLHSTLGV